MRQHLILVVRTQNVKTGSVGYSFLVLSVRAVLASFPLSKQFALCHQAFCSIRHPTQFVGLLGGKVLFLPSSMVLDC